jgi:hypothetical protein
MVDTQSARVTQVDPEGLDTAVGRITEAASILSAGSTPPAITPELIGHDGLSTALTSFYETWTSTLRDLADSGTSIAAGLQDARHAYLAVDQSVIQGGDLR